MSSSPTSSLAEAAPIADYAIIGDCRSAALVSRSGSIDWLCWPHFASPSIFAAILDPLAGGHYSARPTAIHSSHRRYIADTNVLETRYTSEGGELKVIDCMPVGSEDDKTRRLTPDHELLRWIECTEGEVEVEVVYGPRPDYGRRRPKLRLRGPHQVVVQERGSLLTLDSSRPLGLYEPYAGAREVLRAGETWILSLTYCHGEPAVHPGLGDAARERLDHTIQWWREWAGRCKYSERYREPLIRSLLTLKLLTFAPSGAIIAAPTTSLPEVLGGGRNWDYRYSWIRDSSMTVSALLDLGYHLEATAYLDWLMHTTRRTAPEIQTVYNVYGDPHFRERVIPSLVGHRGSSPVRVGNAAPNQLQLDSYGELIAAVSAYVDRGGELGPSEEDLLIGFGELVCDRWREPDEGIWEMRTGRRHHTFSKVLCWAALDRLLCLHGDGSLRKAPVERFARERELLRQAIEERAFCREKNSYVAHFDSTDIDASLLLMPHYGYLDFRDPRAIATRECIEMELSKEHLVGRYRHGDGLQGKEGAFGVCCFWLVWTLAQQGERDRAEKHLQALLDCANDVGLYAEEIGWDDGALLGNFPQGFTHIGVINAILSITRDDPQLQGARGGAS